MAELFSQCDSFGLYALYSKNKPQSDALILHRRHDIFKVSSGFPLTETSELESFSFYLFQGWCFESFLLCLNQTTLEDRLLQFCLKIFHL